MENVKNSVNIPVQGAGKIPIPDTAERVLRENRLDLIGICRPIIVDPEWPNKAREGRESKITKCIYCCHCIDTQRHFIPLSCPLWKDGRNGDPMFKFEPVPEGMRMHCTLTYDKLPYAGKGAIYVPHVEHFPARDK
jgi:hypothetical protein